MPAKREIEGRAGDLSADRLARRLSEAVQARSSGNGAGNGSDGGNGNGRGDRPGAREAAIEIGAAMLAETSSGTAEHSDDVVLICEAIGERMGVSGAETEDLLAAARLHDIGKAWIPRELLVKPRPLSEEEWEVMHQHTLVGERILTSVPELHEVAHLVRHSHERWDGGGYPDGLAGPEIPLGSRIIFCADAFHAIRCDRPYRAGRSARDALAEVTRCAGTQFDPQVASALEQVVRERHRMPRKARASPRLLALLMCLVLGGGGAALARSGVISEPSGGSAAQASGKTTPPACGTAACPSVAGPVGGLGAVGVFTGEPGPRPLSPGLPGQQHRHKKAAGKVRGKSELAHQLHKGKRGKSAEAKARHAAKANGAGHSDGSPQGGNSTGAAHSQGGGAASSPSRGSSSSSGGRHTGARHGSRRASRRHGGQSGASRGNGGASGAHGR
jgi:HD domain